MSVVTRVARRMQSVLFEAANEASARTGLIRRQRKLTASALAQGLVFGWMQHPQATLEQLTRMLRACGADITPQALDQRFTPRMANFLRELFEATLSKVLEAEPISLELLNRFEGVYLTDSTIILLPNQLAELWPGCGGSGRSQRSALKLQVRLELSRGKLLGPMLLPGRTTEQRGPLARMRMAAGALWMADLGYFCLNYFRQLDEQGAFYLSALPFRRLVFDGDGQRLNLLSLLRYSDRLDLQVRVGAEERLPCRLLAWRLSKSAAERRRKAVRRAAVKHGYKASREQLAWCTYRVLITNVPASRLSLLEANVLSRARWQVEMLFKLWKSYGRLDESRSHKPWRQLLEIYAKLIGLVMQHWILLTGGWDQPRRSWFKACRVIQDFALQLAYGIHSLRKTISVLQHLHSHLTHCATNIRNKSPCTDQLLRNPQLAINLT